MAVQSRKARAELQRFNQPACKNVNTRMRLSALAADEIGRMADEEEIGKLVP